MKQSSLKKVNSLTGMLTNDEIFVVFCVHSTMSRDIAAFTNIPKVKWVEWAIQRKLETLKKNLPL